MSVEDAGAALRRAGYIEGLKREREMYVAANRLDRVAGVDEELARMGVPVKRSPAKKSTAKG